MSALITLVLLAAFVVLILERRAEQPAEIRVQLIDVQFPEEPANEAADLGSDP